METQKHSGLFSPGGCLTAHTLWRKLNGTLRYTEKIMVDEHLRCCPICSEALEGFKRHRGKNFMHSDLQSLSGKIRKHYDSNKTIKLGLPVIIVISLFIFLILLLVIYYIIRNMLLT